MTTLIHRKTIETLWKENFNEENGYGCVDLVAVNTILSYRYINR